MSSLKMVRWNSASGSQAMGRSCYWPGASVVRRWRGFLVPSSKNILSQNWHFSRATELKELFEKHVVYSYAAQVSKNRHFTHKPVLIVMACLEPSYFQLARYTSMTVRHASP